MVLPRTLLNPVSYQVQNPFASIIDHMEPWLAEHQPDYLVNKWPKVKYSYIQRILGLAKNGSALRGHSQTAPTHDLSSTLLDIYNMLDHCAYFTSKYWRAYFYWLKTGTISPCWPQFGQREVDMANSLLTPGDIEKLKVEADKEWLDFFSDTNEVNKLFKQLKKPIYSLCYKRISFLSLYDNAMYSLEDVHSQVNMAILVALRKNDYFSSQSSKMMGWAIKCADNAIHNIRIKAVASKRNRIMDDPIFSFHDEFTHRECSITPDEDIDPIDSFLITNLLHEDEVEDNICLNQLINIASSIDPKIDKYLRVICGGEHDADFWSWFYYNEPTLAQRISYIEENPEAIGPYLQRHLGLPTYQLTGFLKQHLPSLLNKVSNTLANRLKMQKGGV